MSQPKQKTIEIPLAAESIETVYIFVEQGLQHNHISKEIIMETLLLIEALFHNLIGQSEGQHPLITVKMQKTFGEINIKMGFEGKPYTPTAKNEHDFLTETRILEAYEDKIDYRYSSGYNNIRIVVKRSYRGAFLRCIAGIVLAILVYIPVSMLVTFDQQIVFKERFVSPLIKLFANGMLMVGAPVTLFSLVKNLTDTFIVSERSSSGRKLLIKTVITSAISVLLALGTSFLIALLLNAYQGYLSGKSAFKVSQSFSELIASVVPSNIFEPFETLMPFPMILVALLITYAFCSVGGYFKPLKKAVDVCYTLFSKMLNVVLFALPFFCFLAILSCLLEGGFEGLLLVVESVLLVIASLIVICIFYLIRLLIGGVKVGPFISRLPQMIRENIRINSAIDAVPYNIRYCARNYGYNRKRLSENLPILAQTNLDGNCFLIMLIAMTLVFLLGIEISWFQIAVIAILVLFLSFGAPNQPGSILIGTLIITYYLKADSIISIAIYLEVFFGTIQNTINVIGDIVTVAIEEQRQRKNS